MKAFIAMIICAFFAGLGAYLGASEHEMERSAFMFIGVIWGFSFRHKIYEE